MTEDFYGIVETPELNTFEDHIAHLAKLKTMPQIAPIPGMIANLEKLIAYIEEDQKNGAQ